MKIVFLEFIDEFKAFEAFAGAQGLRLSDCVIVAVELKLQLYLKGRGIPYQTTLPYLTSEHHKKIILESQRMLDSIRFSFQDGLGLQDCYGVELRHYTRLYINHCSKLLEVIAGACRRHAAGDVYGYVQETTTPSCLMTEGDRYLGRLAQRYAQAQGLRFHRINTADGPDSGKALRGGWAAPRLLGTAVSKMTLSLLRKNPVIFMPPLSDMFANLVKGIHASRPEAALVTLDPKSGGMRTLAINAAMLLRRLIRSAKPTYFALNPAFFPALVSEPERARLFASARQALPQDGFRYDGIDLHDLLQAKLEHAFIPHLGAMLENSYRLKHIFERCPRSMVISFMALDLMGVAGELSRRMGKVSLFVSHGSHPAPIDPIHEVELLNLCRGFMLSAYTHVAIANPVQEKHLAYFKQKHPFVQNTEIRTGPVMFAQIGPGAAARARQRFGIPNDAFVVMQAVTTKARLGERFYFLETLDEFAASLAQTAQAVQEMGDAVLLLRVHPGFFLSDREILSLLPAADRVVISRTGPFAEALPCADILMSYSSTAIDEALINHIPVLLYDPWNRYNHFKTGIFEDADSKDIFPVCYVNDRAKLGAALRYMRGASRAAAGRFDNSAYAFQTDYSANLHRCVKEALGV